MVYHQLADHWYSGEARISGSQTGTGGGYASRGRLEDAEEQDTSGGDFQKLNSMHKALHTKFSFNTPNLDTLAEVKNLSTSIYEGG